MRLEAALLFKQRVTHDVVLLEPMHNGQCDKFISCSTQNASAERSVTFKGFQRTGPKLSIPGLESNVALQDHTWHVRAEALRRALPRQCQAGGSVVAAVATKKLSIRKAPHANELVLRCAEHGCT